MQTEPVPLRLLLILQISGLNAQLALFRNAVGNLTDSLAKGLLPVLTKIVEAGAWFVNLLNKSSANYDSSGCVCRNECGSTCGGRDNRIVYGQSSAVAVCSWRK